MATDHISRRTVLAGLAGSAALPVIPLRADDTKPAFLACCKMEDGGFAAAVLDDNADLMFTERLDDRGHDAAISPDRRLAVVFARRPGRFALAIDLARHHRLTAFAPPPDRHFYGHGFFTRDGRLLCATENDYEAERGVLGVYDVEAGFRRIGEIETGGIGPHEAILMSDGRTIAVANGGIATHPDFPRQKLNLPTMTPSIAYLDLQTGGLLDRADLPANFRKLSIRHLAESVDGELWFGCQYEGAETNDVPLVGTHRRGGDIRLLPAPDDLYRGMNHYVGSVAASRDGNRIATTSPRGGVTVIWDATDRTAIEISDIPDVCGAAARANGFLLSDGLGRLHLASGAASVPGIAAWDNHVSSATERRRA